MERTSFYLDSELKRKLRAAASRAGVSEAQVIRTALACHLAEQERIRPQPVGQSFDGGVAAEDEEALRKMGFGLPDCHREDEGV